MTVKDTELDGAALEVERIPVRFRYQGCATEFDASDFVLDCPTCSRKDAKIIAGDELALSYLELE
jgi:Zn finger protein HypA/HybF involved in hydrogenase expression